MKCPRCGSRKVARILYGMPAWSEKLEKDMKNKKIKLGGCSLTMNDPNYYCYDCRKKIGYPGTAYGNIFSATYIRFKNCSPDGVIREVIMERRKQTVSLSENGTPVYRHFLSYDEWFRTVRGLYLKFYLAEWKRHFINPDGTCDGQWELSIDVGYRSKCIYEGKGAYPPYWKELTKLFAPYFENKAEETGRKILERVKGPAYDIFVRFPGSMKIYNPWSDCTKLTPKQKAVVYEVYRRFWYGMEIPQGSSPTKKHLNLMKRMEALRETCSEKDLKNAINFKGEIIEFDRNRDEKIWYGGELSETGLIMRGPKFISFDLKEAYSIHGNECRKHLTEDQKELFRMENLSWANESRF